MTDARPSSSPLPGTYCSIVESVSLLSRRPYLCCIFDIPDSGRRICDVPDVQRVLLSSFFFFLDHRQVLLVPPVAQPRPTKAPPALPRLPPPSRALTALLFPFVPSLLRTPSTIFSKFVSTTTPPTTISPKTACSVSNPKIRSSSQTFSNSLSRASTKTCIKSSRASGDSVLVEIRMKYNVA
jgi:hypothetical protein